MNAELGLARRITDAPAPAEPKPVCIHAPAPIPDCTQAEMRERRRKWLRVNYGAEFDLTIEVRGIVEPLAAEVAKLPKPAALRREIDALADAVHELLSTVVGMLAESRHLSTDAASRVALAVRDLAQRPEEPVINTDQIVDGTWPEALVAHVQPYSADTAALLGRAEPHSYGSTLSERLVDALRVVDTAALQLQRRLPRVAEHQALPSISEFNAAKRAQRDQERAQRALAKIRVAR